METGELRDIIIQHLDWLKGVPGGKQADLSGVDLSHMLLQGTDFSGAILNGAIFYDSDLDACSFNQTQLTGAIFTCATLVNTDFGDSNLAEADLSAIKADVHSILDATPNEVPGLLRALREGKIDGTAFTGPCACLVGTIAHLRGTDYHHIDCIEADCNRPAERWFLGIRPGNTPGNHTTAAVTEKWIMEWLDKRAGKDDADRQL